MAMLIQNLALPITCHHRMTSSPLPSSSSSLLLSTTIFPQNYRYVRKKWRICRAMVEQNAVEGGGSSSPFTKEIQRLSAKESLLLAQIGCLSSAGELQVIIHDLLAEGLIVNDAFQVATIIEKLPLMWKDFKNYLKHKRKEMTIEDLIVQLRIKEDNKAAERRKSKKKDEANMVKSNKECDDLCAMFSECNLVGNPREWWMDSGATRHVCANKELFSSFAPSQVEEMIYMPNSATAKVEGIGKVGLKMTSGKVLTLNNVLYVPELRRNLISVSLLDKNRFKCVTVSEKIVISKGEVKDEAIDAFRQYKTEVENQLEKKIKMIRSNRGGEYESPFAEVCVENGIVHQTTVSYSPQSNGIAERKNRTLKEMMNVLLISFGLPQNLWGEAILTVNRSILNRVPHNNAEFFENIYPYKTRHEQSSGVSKRPRDEPSENVHNEENLRRSTRQRTSTTFESDFVTFLLENEPQTFKEAMSSSDSFFWKEAVNSEIDSILSNHTWELVDLPPGNKPLGSKWIFKRKMKTNGTIDKYKARLVVKGFKQKEDLGCFDTYSPVTRITSIRMLIALAAVYGLEIHQMDVKTAFLNGELEEEIYMEQPEGFVVPGKENKVCQLIKSLYGLKQAPKQWHAKFDQTMLANGFKINECDKCVYIKDTPNHQVIVCLYVDDMLIISRDIFDINATKRMLESKFDMKDLGVADVILGIRIHRTPQGLALPVSLYRKGYSDANWITGSNEVKSTSGYASSWKSSKQTCIACSTIESEFIALDKAGEEAEWLRNFLEDIPYWPKPMAPVCIHCDSQAAIGRAGSMMYNGKSRHIRQRHNTVKELLSSGIITVDYVKSKDNVSDPLTKGLSREGVERTSKGMGLSSRTSQHGVVTGRTTDVQAIDVNERIISLERLNPTPRPTTSPYLEGLWNFEWFGTACPVFLATRLLFGQENSADIGKFIKIRSANQKWMWDCYCACENIEFEGHGFHPWEQPLAEMLGKAAYNRSLWSGPSPDLAHSGSFSAPGRPFLLHISLIENKFVLSSKFSVEGPLRMKEEYVEGIFETPKVDENFVPEQLKGALDQAANTIQQLPVPIRDTVSRGLKIPLGEAFQRLIMISYLDEEILIARNTAGEPEVLTRLDPAPDPEPISDYES
ncbi:hypothetical protein BC332_26616 [Capsicum chinense]|nr:hypothetical protein BC332_26616 [Capsicum chinense]